MNNLLLRPRSCIFEHKNVSIQTLMEWIETDMINLNPEYQRDVVWNSNQKRKFIDTILLQFPFPSVTLLKNDHNIDYDYECVDGKQRLTSIIHFVEGKFKVQIHPEALKNLASYYYKHKTSIGGKLWNSFKVLTDKEYDKLYGKLFLFQSDDKYAFNQLPIKLQNEFKAYTVSCLILKGKWNHECVFDIFQRIQNGIALTAGEIINAQIHCKVVHLIKSHKDRIIPLLAQLTTKSDKNCNWLLLILGCISIYITKDVKYLHVSRITSFAKDYDQEGPLLEIQIILNFLNILIKNIKAKIDKWDLFLLFYVYAIYTMHFNEFLQFFVSCTKPPEWDYQKESYKTIPKKYQIFLKQRQEKQKQQKQENTPYF